MKRFVCIWVIGLLGSLSLFAQREYPHFLFDDFTESTIVYRDGRQFKAKLNFSLLVNRFIFIDETDDNNLKEFGEPDKIAVVKAGERTFLMNRNGTAKEVLQTQPPITVQYKGKVKGEGKNAGYGGKSETSAIESRSTLYSGGQLHKLEGEKRIVYGIDKTYQIEKDKKTRTFISAKQFLKIYPKIKEQLETYIAENKVDFSSVEQVLALYNYADALD